MPALDTLEQFTIVESDHVGWFHFTVALWASLVITARRLMMSEVRGTAPILS